jgi:NIMA-interacting peptidyl-prolyl cis-trans isomerase 1
MCGFWMLTGQFYALQWEVPTAAVGKGAPSSVRASHILVKHEESRRPSSWRKEFITISKEEALTKLRAIRERIVSGAAKFEDIARVESDCSSADRGGDLGEFGRGKMQKPFEDAAFALQVGELSGIVDTDSGVHIIVRTA